ncbi:hypothetical protein BSZ37_12200 [Rubrivirga marina]|uniref:PorV/PorQ family protein n=2 Tax=Rubrivirga marina TaxID=1196024 RepID=A0A271J256_9BACT|nr:hypothetical protein BSZ37_12200 [Rubrivirga marina]
MTSTRTRTGPHGPTPMHRSLLRRIALVVAAAALAAPAGAQDRVATTAAPFLTLGTGARGQSLGHAYTATATGADALFWNPAGAARTYGSNGTVFLTQHEWLADLRYNAAGVTLPAGAGVLGISLASLDYGRDEVRTERQPEGTGDTFGASDFSFGVSYARPLTEAFYFGGTAKVVRQSIWDMSATGFAADFGISLDTGFNGLTLAASIQNFGTKMRMSGINAQRYIDVDEGTSGNNENVTSELQMEGWDLPLSFRFGASAPIVRMAGAELRVMADAQQTNDNVLNTDLGGMLSYDAGPVRLEARAGYRDAFVEDVDNHLSFGGGLSADVAGYDLGVDVAYLPFDRLGSATLFDLRLEF